ncbi:MarR family winged helix-turn-helix transcriptional regulator [Nocardiopsis dassonvillei]|uniref:MarR family winged helix-turn-helix transcriptional regulator n=1 Tax=Nocardiopsis dassonvillei TaxID=2014 RepID=UPI00366F887E
MRVSAASATAATQDTGLESVTLSLVNLIAHAAHGRHATRKFHEATGIGLPGTQMRTLLALSHGRPVSTGDLAAALDLDLGQTSRQVASVQALGLSERAPDPADRRRSLVAITALGTRVNDRWRDAWSRDYLGPVLTWPEAEVSGLTVWLDRVERSLRHGLSGITVSPGPPDGWYVSVPEAVGSPTLQAYLRTVVGLVEVVGLSRGFDGLLGQVHAPIRQHAYFALHLIDSQGPLPVTEVARRLGVTHPQASKRVRMLCDHGLLTSSNGTRDRRATIARSTAKGSALVRRVREIQLRGFLGLVGEVTPEQREEWARLTQRLLTELTRLLEGMDEDPATAP